MPRQYMMKEADQSYNADGDSGLFVCHVQPVATTLVTSSTH